VKVRALRGVCVGVEQHLVAGASADLDPAQIPFLVSIGAVEVIPDEPLADKSETITPVKAGTKEK
jgi:hypothetical protein